MKHDLPEVPKDEEENDIKEYKKIIKNRGKQRKMGIK